MAEKTKWFERSYRRIVVDSHIADWDERFLSKFDPEKYVEMLTMGKAAAAMVYSCCHCGNCYWPTKIGHQHSGLKGRDALGQIINLFHKKGIHVIVYYSLIHNNWVYKEHPDWAIMKADGKPRSYGMRYGLVCPNSPYRDFAVAQIEELCQNYEFEGMFFDMTYWPDICYCKYCQERYKKEAGQKIPEVINWEDPNWVKFQRKREEWMLEFAHLTTSAVKEIKSEVSVSHQSSTFPATWQVAVPYTLSDECDYTEGDFYGGSLQRSFACKLFFNITKNKPFQFETSRCIDLSDHTTRKTKELLLAEAFLVLAHRGAFMFIDAIDPVGTLDRSIYEMMGEVFGQIEKYEKYLGGDIVQDVAVYFSFESRVSLADNGKRVEEGGFSQDIPHLKAVTGVCKSLLNSHIPFGIITKKNLNELSKYKVIILPEVIMMDNEEVEAFTDYVQSGGGLYASKNTSLLDKDGNRQPDFMLKELLGISYMGMTEEYVTYISPQKVAVIKDITAGIENLTIFGQQTKVKANKDAKVLATLTLPFANPGELTRFASIHSNPPGIRTNFPSITFNRSGKGKVCYVSGNLEAMEYEQHRRLFTYLVKKLAKKPFTVETDAPKSVEIIIFSQREKKRYIVNLINFQQELPNIPVHGINFRMRLNKNERPIRLVKLPEGKRLPFKFSKRNILEVNLARLETFLMLGVEYK